jgi:hypothetical protein
MEHIFDAYSQLQEGQVTGTGLGLFGVRTRAEGLHGVCGVRANTDSCTGTGTIIWFALPYVPDRRCRSYSSTPSEDAWDALNLPGAAQASMNSTQVQSAATSRSITPALTPGGSFIRERHLTAIVVDDTLTVRKLMEKLLLRMGFERVDCYENGSKGLDAMMERQVDIVFSDVQMPIMTGPEVIAMLHSSVASCGFGIERSFPHVLCRWCHGSGSGRTTPCGRGTAPGPSWSWQ